ncbi:glycosyltransferase family 39 protein [uncultured Methanoregula sp.]|uniref:glycosyltransferase family 39 protein n=1 Tax=uncultured Methanoregula sp. TaxID=1005933 RepID=UPI002AAC185B|nr:glycosyltransferase family 39 protein [uncultured Methanoregula sp.]
MTGMAFFEKYRTELVLAGILLLSLFLNLWNLWNQGISNEYYAAAVKSMLENPRVMFFNSFDAAGFVTVDKPPVGLWVQVVSAALLGFSGWALVLPEALAGVGSVALVYLMVSRPFGKPAGLVSAFALGVTPIFVAVSRNGTMDGLLIFVLLLALFTALKAAREQSLPWLLVSVGLIGVGFNIKMIQAFLIVPAVLVIYLMGTRNLGMKTRALHLILAVLVLIIVSLSWTAAVDLVPADQRPFIGGSGDNTVLGLIINYNGIHRLENGMTGQGAGPGSVPSMKGTMLLQQGVFPGPGMQENSRKQDRRMGEGAATGPGSSDPGAMQFSGSGPYGAPAGTPPSGTGGAGGIMAENGTPGLFRLLSEGLAGQISWLLPFTLIGLCALWRRPASISEKGLEETGVFSPRGLTVTALCLWLFPGLLYFSFTTGFWHSYYLATIAPPLAALAGIGALAMYAAYRGKGIPGWILVAAVIITGCVQVRILLYSAEWAGALIPVVALGTIAPALVLVYFRLKPTSRDIRLPTIAAILAIGILFVAPFVWSCTPLAYGSGNLLPSAGPQSTQGGRGMSGGNGFPGQENSTTQLADYLVSHSSGETWIVAVPSSHEAASLILETGRPVISLGGFSGSDNILSTGSLTSLLKAGKVRYFYTPSSDFGGDRMSGNAEVLSWVSSHCSAVPASEYRAGGSNLTAGISSSLQDPASGSSRSGMTGMTGPSGTGMNAGGQQNSESTLYDCAGVV